MSLSLLFLFTTFFRLYNWRPTCRNRSRALARIGQGQLDTARLVSKYAADNQRADVCQQALEHLRRLGFVFYQRIALGVSFQADRHTQCFHTGQVFNPLLSDGLQQQLTMNLIQNLATDLSRAFASSCASSGSPRFESSPCPQARSNTSSASARCSSTSSITSSSGLSCI